MGAFSILPNLDRDVNRILTEQAAVMNLDITNSKEVELRMSQSEFKNGTLCWYIDGQMILRLTREEVTEKVINYALERIQAEAPEAKKRIIVADKSGILHQVHGSKKGIVL